jgi:hypothetical protein
VAPHRRRSVLPKARSHYIPTKSQSRNLPPWFDGSDVVETHDGIVAQHEQIYSGRAFDKLRGFDFFAAWSPSLLDIIAEFQLEEHQKGISSQAFISHWGTAST